MSAHKLGLAFSINSLVKSKKKFFWFLGVIILYLIAVVLFDIKPTWGGVGIILLCFFCELMDS